MSSIKTTEKEGDVSIGRHVGIGGNANVQGNVVVHMNMRVEGWLDAKNIKGSNKGIFTTVKKLREAYPRPHDGWWAIVGNTLPSPIYVGDGGEWVATGESGGTPTLEDTDGALQRAVEEVKEKLTDSKKAIEDMVKNLPIAQEAGDSATSVMSQKAVSDAIKGLEDKVQESAQAIKSVSELGGVILGKEEVITPYEFTEGKEEKGQIFPLKWINIGGTYIHFMINVDGYDAVKLIGHSEKTVKIAFLKSIDNKRNGEDALFAGENKLTSISANTEVTLKIPTDAKFLFVEGGTIFGRSYLQSLTLIKNAKSGILKQVTANTESLDKALKLATESAQAAGAAVSLREKLYGKKTIVSKDSGATVRTHKIVLGKWGNGLYKHMLVSIKGYEKVHLVANPTEGFEYTFLVDDENLQQTKTAPTFAKNYKSEVKAKAGEDIFVDVPVDADYLYVLFYYEFYTPKNKMEPSLIELIKEGDFEGLKKGNSTSYNDGKSVVTLGSSLSQCGQEFKTLSWVERVNDLVDINIVNSARSGGNLETNIDCVSNGDLIYYDSVKTKIVVSRKCYWSFKPSYFLWGNAANGTPAGGLNLYNQLKKAYAVTRQHGAQMILGGEDASLIGQYENNNHLPLLGGAKAYDACIKSFAKDFNVLVSPISVVHDKLTHSASYGDLVYKGTVEKFMGVHGGYRCSSPFLMHADLLGRLPLSKSIKAYKVRETYKNGSPSVTDLVYQGNEERLKFFRGLMPGTNGITPVQKIDNMDNGSHSVPETAIAMTDRVYDSETYHFLNGDEVTFYKWALFEAILEQVLIDKFTFSVISSKRPTGVYYAVINEGVTEWKSANFDYSDGVVSFTANDEDSVIDVSTQDFRKKHILQDYDKVRILVNYADEESWTMAKPVVSGYNGAAKSVQGVENKLRKFGTELMDKTSVESGWTFGGGASVKAFPASMANYTRYNDVKKHIQLEVDGDSCSKTITIEKGVSRVAVRVVTQMFPKYATKRFVGTEDENSEYVDATQATVRPADYNCGKLIVTLNKSAVQHAIIDNGWSESYFEFDVDSSESEISIKIERDTLVDDSYINHLRPLMIHDVSVQKIW